MPTTPNEDATPPFDALALHATHVVQAALEWRKSKQHDQLSTQAEWQLFDACDEYGDTYRGIRRWES